ncbi:SDR family oxidoreductase [Dyadobacter sp. LHD-138]|uniref:SDR family NAD(P)-dependent oxidoreductase n=1 Tax=Dyadobacter sp. LHD-138 TaxID=3071413 RepID=UPI0027DF48FF|nr:SDR family oxidoreductase [Dyadobacter sp. LHD-138]MDQ6479456.1 SDR family oxidoreductase [Dyadobacter sp. LHD-138]
MKVLITGAASGIGLATAMRFAQEGWDVCLNDIQTKKLRRIMQDLPAGNHLIFAGSYADSAAVKSCGKMILEKWGRLDVLVNCAGVSERTDLLEMEPERWRRIFDLMVNGCLMTSRLGISLMSGNGRIIHITSIHGERAEQYGSSYAMAKAAINQFCRSMALELADRNILVNAVAPGFVDTPMSVTDGENELETKWFRDNYIEGNHLPLRRAAMPEEISGVVFFLAGKDASYITGQVITVDGGLTITF